MSIAHTWCTAVHVGKMLTHKKEKKYINLNVSRVDPYSWTLLLCAWKTSRVGTFQEMGLSGWAHALDSAASFDREIIVM